MQSRCSIAQAGILSCFLAATLLLLFGPSWPVEQHFAARGGPLLLSLASNSRTAALLQPGSSSSIALFDRTRSLPPDIRKQIVALMKGGQVIINGDSRSPQVALTFDDGPSLYTPQVLAILRDYKVPATFFVIGRNAAIYQNLVVQEDAEGHVVANHTWTHPHLTLLSDAEIAQQITSTEDLIQRLLHHSPHLFRPPYRNFNQRVLFAIAQLGYRTVLWSDDPQDWRLPGSIAIARQVFEQMHYGAIVILHDGGGNRSETITALPTIITLLRERGYSFVTVPDLISSGKDESVRGSPLVSPIPRQGPQLPELPTAIPIRIPYKPPSSPGPTPGPKKRPEAQPTPSSTVAPVLF